MADFTSTTISKLWKTTLRVQNGYPGNVYHPHVSAPGYYSYSNGYGGDGHSPYFSFTNSVNCTASAFGYASFYTYYGSNRNSTLNSIVTNGVNLTNTGSYNSHSISAATTSPDSKQYWIAKYNYPNSSTSAPVGLYGTRSVSNVTITRVMYTGHNDSPCIVSKIVTPTNKTYYIVTPMYASANESCRNVDIYGYGDHILGLTYAGSSSVSKSEYRTDLDINLSDVVSGTGIYNVLNSLQLPSHIDNTSTASTVKANADTLWNWISNAYGSSWSYYSQAKAKYDTIVAAYSWIPTRDQAYSNLISITTPTNTSDTSTTNTAKNNASSYWSTLNSKDISEWSNYNTAKSKYDAIVAIHSNNTERDSAYNSLTGLSTPTTSTVQATARAAKDTATTQWNTIKAKTTSDWSNYNTAKAKYDAIVAGHAATVTRDTRLTKKADKTELNTSNSKLTFNQAAVHAKGISDYNSINSTLSSVNNKLK